ncbi:putative phage abortive infection protein [uncultured Oceanisphaera sp.]|uniref:putative phage abortive infection protein n=1 Tax=uncultured Oceanisphaera sp. TaxID=353858 RepID=UPI0026361169|nr:putative phage abortive infection protein [uncultured Oceanisphaera sp.]
MANIKNVYLWIMKFIRSLDEAVCEQFESVVGKSNDDTTKNLYKIFRFALIASLIVFLVNLLLRAGFLPSSDWKLGEFGDFFGGILNPILTFLMFIGLIITIVVQKTELALAREEFSRTASSLHEQSQSSKKQVFETTFFNLLKIHSETLESLKFNDKLLCCALNVNTEDTVGRAVFSSILSWMGTDEDDMKKSIENYKSFQDTENHIVGHYFRGLYQILKFIDYSDITKDAKENYSRILRAQLSTDELAVLYFNCICTSVDSGQFRNLLIEFKMLEHLKLGKEDFWKRFTLSSQVIYTVKEDLLKYIEFNDDGTVKRSAFGSNAVASSHLYTHNKSIQQTAISAAD